MLTPTDYALKNLLKLLETKRLVTADEVAKCLDTAVLDSVFADLRNTFVVAPSEKEQELVASVAKDVLVALRENAIVAVLADYGQELCDSPSCIACQVLTLLRTQADGNPQSVGCTRH
jgi:hypothetical protein